MNVKGFVCISCNKYFEFQKNFYTCPSCNGNVQIYYDCEKIKRKWNRKDLEKSKDFSIWRYSPLFPVETRIDIPCTGWTPLYGGTALSSVFGINNLFIKDDSRNPTASLKDRASALIVSHAIEMKAPLIVAASTGNAGSSIAGIASASGIKTVIFVPQNAPAAKLVQIRTYGAQVICVNGTYDDASRLCLKASKKFGWYNRNTGYNPFTREGKKSVSFEICEQLNWDVPDSVVVPVGDGNILSGVWKGFKDFFEIGFIKKLPRLIAVQAENSNAIEKSFRTGSPLTEVSGDTVADSISVSFPGDGEAAVLAIKESGGDAVTVSDREILDMIPVIAKSTGIFVEPAAAAAVAGLAVAVRKKKLDKKEKIVVLLTGSGLKDIDSAMKVIPEVTRIENDESELAKLEKITG